MKLRTGLAVFAVALVSFLLAATTAFAHPNLTASASQECVDNQIVLNAALSNEGFATTASASDSQAGALSPSPQTAPASWTATYPGPDRAGGTVSFAWTATDGDSGTITADYGAVLGCVPPPIIHEPTLTGSGECDRAEGEWIVTYTGDADGGTANPPLPVTRHLEGSSTGDSLTVTFSYADGPDQVRTAEVPLAGDCQENQPPKPPPQHTIVPGSPRQGSPPPPAAPAAPRRQATARTTLPFSGPIAPLWQMLGAAGICLGAGGYGLRKFPARKIPG